MPPTLTDTGHGALYDLFPEHANRIHGGALFDEGFGVQPKDAPKGAVYDEFGAPTYDPQHGGPLWDEFAPWQSVDEAHGGLLYDQGFGEHTANTSDRGTLFDLFEGKQARYMFDGQDAEGIVVKVRADGIMEVQPRQGGQLVEVELDQFLALASPSVDNAGTTAPRSTAEAPSAWSPDARGGGRGAPPSPGQPIEATPQGQYTEPRSGVPDGSWSVVDGLKTMLSGVDVAKSGMGFGGDSAMSAREVKHVNDVDFNHHVIYMHPKQGQKTGLVTHSERGSTHVTIGGGPKVKRSDISHIHTGGPGGYRPLEGHMSRFGKTTPSDGLRSWSLFGQVAKETTVAQTAIQAEDNAAAFAGPKNAGSYCPECRTEKGKLTDDGRCPDCNTVLKAHEKAGPVPREKGDGNGDAESSGGKGVAEKTANLKPGAKVSFYHSGAFGHGTISKPIVNQPSGTHRIAVSHWGGMKHGGEAYVPHGEVSELGLRKTTSLIPDVFKAWGAPGDARPGGQTNTIPAQQETPSGKPKQAKGDPPDVPVPERAHASSDHHSDVSQPRTCPHCGQPLHELDEKDAQGRPSRTTDSGEYDPPVTAHKCLEGFLDMLKAAA